MSGSDRMAMLASVAEDFWEAEPDFDDITEELFDLEEEETEDQERISKERTALMEEVPIDLEDMHEWINDLQGAKQRVFDEFIEEFGGLKAWLHFAGFMVDDVDDWFNTVA